MKKTKYFLFSLLFILSTPALFAQNGLNFDGSDDFVQTSYSGVLGTNDRTFEAWIQLNVIPTSNLAIIDYGSGSAGSRNTFMVSSNGTLSFISGGTNANIGSGTNLVPISQWVHVAFVLDNGTGYLYMDGVQVGTGNLTSVSTPSNGDALRIGERVSGGSILFEGNMDEVRIWNVARSQQEISTYMNSDLCGTPSGLTAYYKLDEGVAGGPNPGVTTTIDEVATANGTLNNFDLIGSTSNWVNGKLLDNAITVNDQIFNECTGFSVNVGTNTYNTTGVYADTLFGASIDGCDSIINTDLTISPDVTFNQTLIECSGSSVTIGTNTYTTSGVYTDVLTGPNGCDSTVITDLTFSPEIVFNQTFDECAGFSITVGSNTYDSTGNYADTLVGAAASGCDSIVNTFLTIESEIDVMVTSASITLTADQNGATYQWLDCNDNFSAIPGETNQSFTATANGDYAVEITIGNCSDTSACMPITTVSLDELTKNNISVYPNPTTNSLKVDLGDHMDVVNYSITSFTGQVILENTVKNTSSISLDVSHMAKGVYFLNLNSITYKIIKQ